MVVDVIKYNQFFKIKHPDIASIKYKLFPINKELVTYRLDIKRGKTKIVVDKEFYLVDYRDTSIRYPIYFYNKIIGYLKSLGFKINEMEVPSPKGRLIDIKPNPNFTPRDYQKEFIEEIKHRDKPTLLINLRTGMGKTFTVLAAMAELKRPFLVLVLAKYVDKWIEDITHYTDIKRDEIYVVQGGKPLRNLLAMKKQDARKYKAYVFSLNTITNYIKTWLKPDELFDYDKSPEELLPFLKVPYVINDETHQEFHNVFYTQLFFNSRLFIGLTATLIHNKTRMNNMYNVLFPIEDRPKIKVKYDRYINVVAVSYRYSNIKKIRYKRAQGYNHPLLESSISKQPKMLKNYFELIYQLLVKYYVDKRDKGDKALVFFSTVEYCKMFKDYLSSKPEINKFKISKYTEEDNYDIIKDSDIIISTVLSSGTALDIPNLITVIQTIAISSIQANKQTIGRLRNLKDKEVTFVYIWSPDIDKHTKYHKERLDYFRDIAKTYKHIRYTVPV